MVLLKNDGGVLPLDAGLAAHPRGHRPPGRRRREPGRPRLSRVYPPDVVTPLHGLREHLGAARASSTSRDRHRAGPRSSPARPTRWSWSRASTTATRASRSRRSRKDERGGDRETSACSADERELILAVAAQNPRTVVVLIGGSAITMEEWRDEAPAHPHGLLPRHGGGRGPRPHPLRRREPLGQAAVHHPGGRRRGCPPSTPSAERSSTATTTATPWPRRRASSRRFPFGFGLSYTRFAYANLALSAPEVAAGRQPRRLGGRDQRGPARGRGGRAALRGLPGLEGGPAGEAAARLRQGGPRPGGDEARHVPVKAEDLAYYDVGAKAWVVERMEYTVLVGGSSRSSDLLTAPFRVTD